MAGKSTAAWTAEPPDISTTLTDDSVDGMPGGSLVGPEAGTARLLAEVLADVVRVERVSADSHFFDDLGADSMVMAQFCARVRKRADLPSVSMKDVYRHPTVNSLADALTGPAAAAMAPVATATAPTTATSTAPAPMPVQQSVPASASSSASAPAPAPAPVSTAAEASSGAAVSATRAGTRQYLLCGMLQLLFFLGYTYLTALATARGYEWISDGPALADRYLRSVLAGGVAFVGMCTIPILAKWALLGRSTACQFPVWSLTYVRWWIVKTLIRISPMRLFTASPLYVLYLRALGAKIGRNVAIFSTHIPVCTDLLTIGDGTVVRKDSLFSCYRAHDGLIQTGPVTLGKDVVVSEQTVLDINTSMGDASQLGHASSLYAGQTVPAGERWHGSPGEPTVTDFRTVGAADCSTASKVLYSIGQMLALLLVHLPLAMGAMTLVLTELPQVNTLLNAGSSPFAGWTFLLGALAASFVLFFGAAFAGLVIQGTLPRLLNLAIKPDKVYPLYGFHYGLQRAIAALTNRKFFITLFGDSSAIVHYLRYLGYDLSRVTQTGSNFGTEVKHDSPFLSSVGSKTMVADGLSIINADFSNTSFSLSRASIGADCFLGNRIAYPSRARTGDNCLLATKVMVPVDGEVREGVGLLGSPAFAIPRTVMRDTELNHVASGSELSHRLAAKNRHNAVTAAIYLLARWIHVFAVTLIAMGANALYPSFGVSAIALAGVVTLAFTVCYFALIERASTGFKAQESLNCSIYEPSFWRHERFWKMAAVDYAQFFDGTPFKNVVWRLMGARIGKRVFDDGCFFPERTLVTIGDDCTLNAGTVIQCHSQEDGAFKSDRTTIGAGCTLGVGAFVHYGVTMADRVHLACDSFLMKGEHVPSGARWGGNPAQHLSDGNLHVQALAAGGS
ncbi:Pls/PosA family non-ribosomal peptide synthetase [Streptomyces himalayensis]|uniref:Peptide synthetase n=1 Tax=Streptomyces himalayensis subsp. himalayensis TaxID=2756131 RepID=A0A7W0ICI2_9ACTN|nr:peptide synthetase [Streptomyces himalayensis subsp. himalayensis]